MWAGSALGGFTNWWNTLNIGNLSEAWAAAGSLAVVLVTLWLTYRESRKHRYQEARARILEEAREAREREARVEAVSIRIKEGFNMRRNLPSNDSVYGNTITVPAISAEIHNSSTLPIYDLHVCVQPKGPGDHGTLEESLFLADSLRSMRVAAAGESIEDIMIAVDEVTTDRSGKTRPTMGLRFRDVRHNEWWSSENGELHHLGNSWIAASELSMKLRALDKAYRPWHQKSLGSLMSVPQEIRKRLAFRWLRRYAAKLAQKRRRAELASAPPPDRVSPQPTPPAPPATAQAAAPPDLGAAS